MKQFLRRGAALGLALAMTVTAASASQALGWDLHTGTAPISVGTTLTTNYFWSDTYSDLRTEHYVTYTPSTDVTPTVAYGTKVTDRVTLTGMAQQLESQGKRVVSGLNGDWYVLSTGAPTGLVVTDGVVRATGYYSSTWAIGFYDDGTAFIAQNGLSMSVTLGGATLNLSGGINKVRKMTSSDGSGGLTLLTSDFADTTKNSEAGVDVILTPVEDESGTYSTEPRIGRQTQYVVEQVLESTGSIAIPEGKAVLTLNAKDNADTLAKLRALVPGDTVTLSITSTDARWNDVDQALGGVAKLVTNGQAASGLDASRTAWPAIGIKADGTLVFYALDGKQPGLSVGATQTQVAQRLIELGCVEAICMDGGGSTTIGVTYPDGSSMEVVNSPSDGSQRANSTAIFLTTELQPTGELDSYYVTPTDNLLLSGAAVQLSASGLDTHYYPTSGYEVEWEVTEGGGTVDENGLFTAGTESGTSRVTADDGYASGTVSITTVSTPDSITLSDESTGAAVTSLNLDPGGQMDLKASASYRGLDLTAQDTCFTWTADPAVGTVDENGLFTAGEKSASGTLTVSAGGKTLTIPVSVAGHVNTLEDLEGGMDAFTATDTAVPAVETGLEYVHNGRQSLKMTYDASSGSASLGAALAIPAGESWLGMWVYGDGSGNTLMATVTDSQLQTSQILLTALNFTGWQYVSAELPEGAAYLNSLDVVYGGTAASGEIWLDQLTTANENVSDTTAPAVTLTVSGAQLTARVSDNVDRTIPQESVSLTYDGAALSFTWNESTGTLSASLPAADTGYHRATVTVSDASGNLGRASADIQPASDRTSPFADMTGHWAEQYATYLYDNGISMGTGVDTVVYQPDKSITRAEFFTMVARWMDLDLTQYAGVELPFVDAASIPDWALDAVKAMYSLGILQGAGVEGGLAANASATISRAEAMTILGRTQAKGYAQPELTTDDAGQVGDWALPYVQSLVGQGVVTPTDNKLRPTDALTRGELAQLLYAIL
ncbi:phosphodiester glycosidase family protein [Flavonifractor sp. An10]|uniref:phosphodiester glycosidase family protein n=1 Tax=Flavonifractor sp. An10 TaxID=1965537 RepID=UPI000B39FFF6|nr:phosphodiester glycosidase family protein [Flavonifractor sp. An10]OUQ82083.1 hypothetical protein B5E42_11160 [Flavonifractor sp. An10]